MVPPRPFGSLWVWKLLTGRFYLMALLAVKGGKTAKQAG